MSSMCNKSGLQERPNHMCRSKVKYAHIADEEDKCNENDLRIKQNNNLRNFHIRKQGQYIRR